MTFADCEGCIECTEYDEYFYCERYGQEISRVNCCDGCDDDYDYDDDEDDDYDYDCDEDDESLE